MPRKPVLVQLSDELLARLDQLSQARGDSRSSVVRDALERYIVQESIADKDRRMRGGYMRIPDDDTFDRWAEESLEDVLDEESW